MMLFIGGLFLGFALGFFLFGLLNAAREITQEKRR